MSNGEFASKMAIARQQNGLNQGELARKVGVSQATVSNWETGKQRPDERQFNKVRAILGDNLFSSQSVQGPSDGVSIVGPWLSRARQRRGLTQQELADKAGVSKVTISLIETGRALNPRTKTIRLLEKALEERLEDAAMRQLEKASEVKGLGTFEDFNPHDESEYPHESGVYVFYDISERPIYVGMASNIASRIKEHKDKFWFKQPIVESASYIAVRDDTLRRQIETTLIKFLKSNAVINKQQVGRQ